MSDNPYSSFPTNSIPDLFVSMEEMIGVAEIANNTVLRLMQAGVSVHISTRSFLEIVTKKLVKINELALEDERRKKLATDKAAADAAAQAAINKAAEEVAALDSTQLSPKVKDMVVAEGGVPALVDRLKVLKQKQEKPARARHPKKRPEQDEVGE